MDREGGVVLIDMELVRGRNLSEILRAQTVGEGAVRRGGFRAAIGILVGEQVSHQLSS